MASEGIAEVSQLRGFTSGIPKFAVTRFWDCAS